MSYETVLREPPHDIAQDAREEQDDTVAMIIAVPVIELLEVIQIRLTDGELLAPGQPFPDVPLDLTRTRQAGRGMHRDVSLCTAHHELEP